jgi:hypothetical protein
VTDSGRDYRRKPGGGKKATYSDRTYFAGIVYVLRTGVIWGRTGGNLIRSLLEARVAFPSPGEEQNLCLDAGYVGKGRDVLDCGYTPHIRFQSAAMGRGMLLFVDEPVLKAPPEVRDDRPFVLRLVDSGCGHDHP